MPAAEGVLIETDLLNRMRRQAQIPYPHSYAAPTPRIPPKCDTRSKGRRLITHNNSRQLRALRDLPAKALMCSLRFLLFQADCRILWRAALTRESSIWRSARRTH